MRVSFRLLLASIVFVAVWAPMVAVVVLFSSRAQQQALRSTEERLVPQVSRLASRISRSLAAAESVARLTVSDFAAGSLVFEDTPQGLRDLRRRWHSVLQAHRIASDVQIITSPQSQFPGRLVGVLEPSRGGSAAWWWTAENGTMQQWALDTATLEPTELEFSDHWAGPFFGMLEAVWPEGAEECWLPIMPDTAMGQVWTTFMAHTRLPGSGTVWAYTLVDLVVQDMVAVFAGITVPDGLGLLVDAATATLLSATSPAVPTFRDAGGVFLPVLANESTGNSTDERRVDAVNALVERERASSWSTAARCCSGSPTSAGPASPSSSPSSRCAPARPSTSSPSLLPPRPLRPPWPASRCSATSS
eukprot:m51a1_g12783 hypothetical protein (361) ;mRNA; r:149-1286